MTVNIRLEEEKDYRIVEEITRDAFWNLYLPGAEEHYVAHSLRKHPDFIPELTFVIELDGNIIGSIFTAMPKSSLPKEQNIPLFLLVLLVSNLTIIDKVMVKC